MPLRHLRQRGEHGGDVEVRQIDRAEFLDDHIEVGEQRRIVLGVGLRAGEPQQPVGERRRILFRDGEDHVFEHGAGFRVEPSGHAEVEQHDLPAVHHDVAGVRVGVEESFVEHLRGVVVDQFGADLLEVVAGLHQPVGVGDGDALHIVHHDYVFGAQVRIGLRAVHVPVSFAEPFEFRQIARFDEEVGFRFEGVPQLLDHAGEVDHLRAAHGFRGEPRDGAHDGHILRHGFAHARALHLDRHVLAGAQFRAMHLREACRAERRGVDVLEDLVRRASVFVFQHAQHRVVGHGVGVGAQFGEFVAEGLRQNLGAHRQYLADFHERRAERFEHQPHFDRREPVHGIEVVGDARDLHEPPQLAASGEVVAL